MSLLQERFDDLANRIADVEDDLTSEAEAKSPDTDAA